jgi:hypothetical protein
MAKPSEKLAESLKVLGELQNRRGIAIIKADQLSRTHRERLLEKGFIREVLKGWYISCNPEEKQGDTTSWYMSYWDFIADYCSSRFGMDWCLSPDQSLSLHSGNLSAPVQLLVRSPKASNNVVNLIHKTSILDVKLEIPDAKERVTRDGVQVCSLEYGLVSVKEDFFVRHKTEARTCLAMVKDVSGILALLLDGGKSVVAGRLAGAFRNIGNDRIANEILYAMKSADHDVREIDPLQERLALNLNAREPSLYVNRIKIMWEQMRNPVIEHFPPAPKIKMNTDDYLKQVQDNYTSDAYHSLSIEGYRVTPELIEKVASGNWNPEQNEQDRQQKDAMAARGYYLAFQAVKESIRTILGGENPGKVVDDDHGKWLRELFAPSVAVGILKPAELAGYRNEPVYIKGSLHTPPSPDTVRDAMTTLVDLLRDETHPGVRAVLGHFVFVYNHPYTDGNGRIARFLMNAMLASGNFPWTVIKLDKRDSYMKALETASVKSDITAFAKFIAEQVSESMDAETK